MTPIKFKYCESDPQPIAVETTNILATIRAEVHHILYLQLCL